MFNNKRVIGITGPSVFNDEIRDLAETRYGGIPLYITQNENEHLDFVVANIDALILAGGTDIFCGTYGEPITRGDGLTKFDIKRDRREIYLIEACKKAQKPILAICRGMQLVCVNAGFAFQKDISYAEIAHAAGEIKINLEDGEFSHFVENLPEFRKTWFDAPLPCNSYHHQAVLFHSNYRIVDGFQVIAIADTFLDKKKNQQIVEIIDNPEQKIIGCQFHPEADWQFGNVVSNLVLDHFEAYLNL